ncbi:MAG: outer membrane beta-barrel protein [Nitrospirae bacterium]|nr:outer membrane beta-barrel protein [Nitrospirota bacterium]
MRKKVLLALSVLLFLGGRAYSQEQAGYAKENIVTLKIGGHFYPGSDFMDYWKADSSDFDSIAFELSYERMLNSVIGIEVPVGYNQAEATYNTVVASGDTAKIHIENLYISPTLKLHIPMNRNFEAYAGGGCDFYRTNVDMDYTTTIPTAVNESESISTFGFHGLAGIDWYFYNLQANIPVSLFAEYKYTWLVAENADKKVLDALSSSASKHDLEAGGSHFFTGVRWHFQ